MNMNENGDEDEEKERRPKYQIIKINKLIKFTVKNLFY